jgi:hypothetical protein
MNTYETALVMTLLFVLRLAFPLLATLIFAYGMNRLLDYWIAHNVL